MPKLIRVKDIPKNQEHFKIRPHIGKILQVVDETRSYYYCKQPGDTGDIRTHIGWDKDRFEVVGHDLEEAKEETLDEIVGVDE